MDKAKVRWERDLCVAYSDQQWKKLKLYNQTFSVNTGTQESHFEILNRWYLTPRRLIKMNPRTE